MSHVRVRRVSAILVVVALAFVALPAADARPLAGSRPTAGGPASWVTAFSHWVSELLAQPPVGRPAVRSTSAALLGDTTGGTMHTNTGSCIDPDGKPVPCGHY